MNPSQLPASADSNPMQKLGLPMLLAFYFFLESRVLDFTFPALHIPLILSLLSLAFALMSGRLLDFVRTPLGRAQVLFFLWVPFVVPFSIFKTGCLPTVEVVARTFLLFIATSALIATARDVRWFLMAIALGVFVAACLSLVLGHDVEGDRLGLAWGRFGDPNDYAAMLLAGLPMWGVTLARGNIVLRALSVVPVALILIVFAQTGSRGGMLAFAALCLALFLSLGTSRKFIMLIASLAFFVLALGVMPSSIRLRYTTMFSMNEEEASDELIDEEGRNMITGAAMSAQGRWQIMVLSLKTTIQHPLFGVGPGNFPLHMFDEGVKEGKKIRGMQTHNTFTQVSSETGIPGAILFAAVMWLALKQTMRLRREWGGRKGEPAESIWVAASCLRLSLIATLAGAMFLSMAWHNTLYSTIAAVVALQLVAARESARLAHAGALDDGMGHGSPAGNGARGPEKNQQKPLLPRRLRPRLRPLSSGRI